MFFEVNTFIEGDVVIKFYHQSFIFSKDTEVELCKVSFNTAFVNSNNLMDFDACDIDGFPDGSILCDRLDRFSADCEMRLFFQDEHHFKLNNSYNDEDI